jgi:hypothetical protein
MTENRSVLYNLEITSKSYVDRILLYNAEHEHIGEMYYVQNDGEDIKWNAEIKKEKYAYIYLLGGEGRTEYEFNDLFSKPISLAELRALSEKGTLYWNNTIVINVPREAPQSVKAVLLEIPHQWQKFWKLSSLEEFTRIDTEKLKLDLVNPSDYFKRGFDHNAQQWICNFDLQIPNADFIRAIDEDSFSRLLKVKFSICIYISHKKYRITI